MSTAAETSLSGQDLAFLAWESAKRPMHIAATAEFEGTECELRSVEALREKLLPSVLAEPMLTRRLLRRRWRTPRWSAPEAIDLAAHVRSLSELAKPGESLEDTRARVLAAPLDAERPLWEIWLEPTDPTAPLRLHFKVHHVVADGIGALSLLERLFGSADSVPAPGRRPRARAPASATGDTNAPPARAHAKRAEREERRTRSGGLLRFVREHLTRGVRTPLSGTVGRGRTYHSLSLDAGAFQALRAQQDVSANDTLLALVAGALERWLAAEPGASVPESVRAFCPVSLRAPGERNGGNRIAPWFVPLPIGGVSRAERALAIQAATRRLRRQRAERGGDRMAQLVRRLGTWLARLGMAVAAWRNAFDLVVTNLPGPRSTVTLSKGRLSKLAAHPPLFPGQRVCIAVVQTDDRWTLALHTGFQDARRADRLAAALRAELHDALSPFEANGTSEARSSDPASRPRTGAA